jgi:peroxiredoxin
MINILLAADGRAWFNVQRSDLWIQGARSMSPSGARFVRAPGGVEMRYGILGILTVAAAVAWAMLLWLEDRERSEVPAHEFIPAKPAVEKHFVTPEQLVECGASAERRIEPFSAVAHDGARFTWPAAGEARPLVVVFIKRGCPCSVEFEPFFHRLEQRYRDAADFVGVIDADPDSARDFAAANKVPYRVLADPDRAIIARFEAKNGGYVALLGVGGQLDTLWPGCSAEMMRALGRRIATLCALAERPLDVSDLPKVLTTGCPYAS